MASNDLSLDMRGALFVVDVVLRKARDDKHKRRTSIDASTPFLLGKERREPSERAAVRMMPLLGSWLKRLAVHRRQQKTLDKIRAMTEKWHQEGWMTEEQITPIKRLLDGGSLPPEVTAAAAGGQGEGEGGRPCAPPPPSVDVIQPLESGKVSAVVEPQVEPEVQPEKPPEARPDEAGPDKAKDKAVPEEAQTPKGKGPGAAKLEDMLATPRGLARANSDERQVPSSQSQPTCSQETPLRKSQHQRAGSHESMTLSRASSGESLAAGAPIDRKRTLTRGDIEPASSKKLRRPDRPLESKPGAQLANLPQPRRNAVRLPDTWKVRGDCRCLFRAVHRACHDPKNDIARDGRGEPFNESARSSEREAADKLRSAVCKAMRKRQDELAGLLAGMEGVNEYVSRMQDWQTWGDAICLHFLPDIIGHPVQVYALNTKKQVIYESGMHLPQDTALHKAEAIVLWYNGRSHYDLVSLDWLSARERAAFRVGAKDTTAPEELRRVSI